ncbi:MAG: S8 family serine peptidase, partial [Chloroflexota bacterium]
AFTATVIYFIRRKTIQWQVEKAGFGFLVAAIGAMPLAIYGSLGSTSDTILSLLAGLGFGFLAALLMDSTTGNVLLDALGIGALLSLLGAAIGYDGGQLILLAILPPFAFAISALMPSRSAAAVASGLLMAAGLAFFDPTELTILLGDIGRLANIACLIGILLGWVSGVVVLVLQRATRSGPGAETTRLIGWVSAIVGWAAVVLIFFFIGNPGNYSDRLFVLFKEQADISDVVNIEDRNERLTAAYTRLTQHANESQAETREFLDSVGVEYTPYYLENAMEVRGGTLVQLYLMTRPEVDRVIPSPRLRAVPPDLPSPGPLTTVNEEVQWNITLIGADRVWEEFGVRGEGIVVGQSDSGVDGDHPAVHDQYRGLSEGDDYNWFDPWDGTTSPNDEGGHGTYTLGTILGADGIGVAPEAQWFGCVNLDRNLGNPALYLDCMQFMLAPFPHGGDSFTEGDPTRAAHVTNNSWGCPPIEGCNANALKQAADNLRYAGIFVVVATGNDGPNCSTVTDPISLYDSVFSVGAIDQNGDVAFFSSRGPVTVDGSGRVKPDIVAPGQDVFSSAPDGTYMINMGTSIAGPHVTGAVALIWSAAPELIGDIDATEQLLIDTARPYTGDTSFGCFTGGTPNNAYGFGVLDVYEAVKQALGQ